MTQKIQDTVERLGPGLRLATPALLFLVTIISTMILTGVNEANVHNKELSVEFRAMRGEFTNFKFDTMNLFHEHDKRIMRLENGYYGDRKEP